MRCQARHSPMLQDVRAHTQTPERARAHMQVHVCVHVRMRAPQHSKPSKRPPISFALTTINDLTEQVLGHTYGIPAPHVRRLVSAGRLVLVDLDRVEQALALKASGFKARESAWDTRARRNTLTLALMGDISPARGVDVFPLHEHHMPGQRRNAHWPTPWSVDRGGCQLLQPPTPPTAPQANYILLRPPSLETLQQRLRREVLSNPPLGYEPQAAADAVCGQAAAEVAAGEAAAGAFNAVVTVDPEVGVCVIRPQPLPRFQRCLGHA